MLIPLFPLQVVLFPGMVLPLHIFEPRYRLMVKRLLAGDRRFGIVLIDEGREVGDPAATTFQVGTLAEISNVEATESGEFMLMCVGVRRFRIDRLVEGQPYAQAEVTLLEEGDPAAPVPDGLMERGKQALDAYFQALSIITNLQVTLPDEQLSSIDLSYLMAAALQTEPRRKQSLLEAGTATERLEALIPMLEGETEAIAAHLARSRARGDIYFKGYRVSLN